MKASRKILSNRWDLFLVAAQVDPFKQFKTTEETSVYIILTQEEYSALDERIHPIFYIQSFYS